MEVALSGFLSSVCATKAIKRSLLPLYVDLESNRFWDSACNLWKIRSSQNSTPVLSIYQSSWNKELYDYRYQELLHSLDLEEKDRLLATSSQSASDWLHAVPVPSLGLRLDPMSLKNFRWASPWLQSMSFLSMYLRHKS